MTTAGGAGDQGRAELVARLRRVMDPELGLDIVTLGLVYGLTLVNRDVTVVMTLTAPGCPLQDSITDGVRRVLSGVPWVRSVTVQLVWEPQWTPERICR